MESQSTWDIQPTIELSDLKHPKESESDIKHNNNGRKFHQIYWEVFMLDKTEENISAGPEMEDYERKKETHSKSNLKSNIVSKNSFDL